jgi:acyl carrier protein
MVDLDSILRDAVNRITVNQYASLPLDLSLSEVGLDSLGLSQIVLSIEEGTGWQLDDQMLDDLLNEKTIGGVRDLLLGHYGRT